METTYNIPGNMIVFTSIINYTKKLEMQLIIVYVTNVYRYLKYNYLQFETTKLTDLGNPEPHHKKSSHMQ